MNDISILFCCERSIIIKNFDYYMTVCKDFPHAKKISFENEYDMYSYLFSRKIMNAYCIIICTANVFYTSIEQMLFKSRQVDLSKSLSNESDLKYYRLNGKIHFLLLKDNPSSYKNALHLIQHYNYIMSNVHTSIISQKVSSCLKLKKLTISTAESCTGGLIVKMLTDIPGSSSYVKGGICTYTAESKVNLLDIPRAVLNDYGIVSPQTAIYMSRRVRKKFHSDIGLSSTGVAGPGADSDGNPEGLVYLGLSTPSSTRVYKYTPNSDFALVDRNFIRHETSIILLKKLFQNCNIKLHTFAPHHTCGVKSC